VSDNGQRLYIANGINNTEQAYERVAYGPWTKVEVTNDMRMAGHLEIRRHIDEVARLYQLPSGW
jgi:hypothetical protein